MTEAAVVPSAAARTLLLQLGTAMVAGGQPIYEVEEDLRRVAYSLGYHHAQVSAMPTSVWVSMDVGEPAAMNKVSAPLSLEQSTEINKIRRRVMSGRSSVDEALVAIAGLSDYRPRYGDRGVAIGNMFVGLGICLIMQPAWPNILVAALLGLVVALLMHLSRHVRLVATLLPTIAAFVVASAAFALTHMGIMDGPLRTLICSIAVLLPGATLATGMAELAAGSMVSGSSRFVYGAVQMLLFTVGVLAAAKTFQVPPHYLGNNLVAAGAIWLPPLALMSITTGITLMESLPLRLTPWVFGLLCVTFVAQFGTQALAGVSGYGGFVGAVVASFGAGMLAALKPSLPRLVVFLPSFWLLVPGTLGVIGIAGVSGHQGQATDGLVSVAGLVMGIALGLLFGSALARPIQSYARRKRREKAVLVPLTTHVVPEDTGIDIQPPMPRPGLD